MYSSMENSPVKSISDQSWKCLKSFKAFNLESYCSLNVFCCLFGDIFIAGGWVRKVSRFFSSAMDLWSLLLLQTLLFPATVCACTSLWTIDKGYIHICSGRVYVRNRPYKATHQCLFIYNSRSLGDIWFTYLLWCQKAWMSIPECLDALQKSVKASITHLLMNIFRSVVWCVMGFIFCWVIPLWMFL